MPVTTQLHEHAEALLVWNKTCFYEVLAPFYRKVCNIPGSAVPPCTQVLKS